MNRHALPALGASLALVAGTSSAEPSFEFLGTAREVPRGWSASRDTPAMTMTVFARPGVTAGGEFALFSVRSSDFTVRTGFAGFLELEVDSETSGVNSGPLPSGDGKLLWRGAYAYQSALARRARCAALRRVRARVDTSVPTREPALQRQQLG